MASQMLRQLPEQCKLLILEHSAGCGGKLVMLSDDVTRPSYKDFGIRGKSILMLQQTMAIPISSRVIIMSVIK